MNYIPAAGERTMHGGDRAYDTYSRLLQDRIILMGAPIDDQRPVLEYGGLSATLTEMARNKNDLVTSRREDWPWAGRTSMAP